MSALKSGINSVKDLKGKKVGSQPGSATDAVFLNKILPKAGLTKDDVQLVNVRFQNHVSALASGSIDAFAGVEPFPSVAEVEKLGKVLTDYSDYDLQPIILAANKSAVDKNKDGVVAFMRGWLTGVKIYQEKRDQATAIVLKHFKDQGFSVTDEVIKLMLSKIDVNPDFGPQLKTYLTDEAKTLLDQKKIDAMPDWNARLNGSVLSPRAPRPDPRTPMRRTLSIGLPLATFAVIAAAWQILATYGGFPPKLVPGLGTIADAFVRLAGNGMLLAATVATLYRLVAGFAIAAIIGVSLGIAMGRRQWIEDTLLPIVSVPLSDPRPRLCAVVRAVVRPRRFSDHLAGRRVIELHRHRSIPGRA